MGLTNTQFNTIMRDYQRQQSANRQALAERTEEIYSRFPEFARLDSSIASASTSCARAMLDNGSCSVEDLKIQIAAFSRQKTAILKEAG